MINKYHVRFIRQWILQLFGLDHLTSLSAQYMAEHSYKWICFTFIIR